MALVDFAIPEESSFKKLPYLKDFLKEYPDVDGQVFTVAEVVETKEFLLIKTSAFLVTLWRSSPIYNQLLQAVSKAFEEKIPVCPLVVSINMDLPLHYSLAIDDSLETNWEKKKGTGKQLSIYKSSLGDLGIYSTQSEENPLFVPSSSSRKKKVNNSSRAHEGSPIPSTPTRNGRKDAASEAVISFAKVSPGGFEMDGSSDQETEAF